MDSTLPANSSSISGQIKDNLSVLSSETHEINDGSQSETTDLDRHENKQLNEPIRKPFKTEYKSMFTPFDQYTYNEATDSFVKQTTTQFSASLSNQDLASNLNTQDASIYEPPVEGSDSNHLINEPWYKEVVKRNEKANEYRFKSEVGHNSPLLNLTGRSESPMDTKSASSSGGPLDSVANQAVQCDSKLQQSEKSYKFSPHDYKRDNLILQMANNNNFNLHKDPHVDTSSSKYPKRFTGVRQATKSASQIRATNLSTAARQPNSTISTQSVMRTQPASKSQLVNNPARLTKTTTSSYKVQSKVSVPSDSTKRPSTARPNTVSGLHSSARSSNNPSNSQSRDGLRSSTITATKRAPISTRTPLKAKPTPDTNRIKSAKPTLVSASDTSSEPKKVSRTSLKSSPSINRNLLSSNSNNQPSIDTNAIAPIETQVDDTPPKSVDKLLLDRREDEATKKEISTDLTPNQNDDMQMKKESSVDSDDDAKSVDKPNNEVSLNYLEDEVRVDTAPVAPTLQQEIEVSSLDCEDIKISSPDLINDDIAIDDERMHDNVSTKEAINELPVECLNDSRGDVIVESADQMHSTLIRLSPAEVASGSSESSESSEYSESSESSSDDDVNDDDVNVEVAKEEPVELAPIIQSKDEHQNLDNFTEQPSDEVKSEISEEVLVEQENAAPVDELHDEIWPVKQLEKVDSLDEVHADLNNRMNDLIEKEAGETSSESNNELPQDDISTKEAGGGLLAKNDLNDSLGQVDTVQLADQVHDPLIRLTPEEPLESSSDDQESNGEPFELIAIDQHEDDKFDSFMQKAIDEPVIEQPKNVSTYITENVALIELDNDNETSGNSPIEQVVTLMDNIHANFESRVDDTNDIKHDDATTTKQVDTDVFTNQLDETFSQLINLQDSNVTEQQEAIIVAPVVEGEKHVAEKTDNIRF